MLLVMGLLVMCLCSIGYGASDGCGDGCDSLGGGCDDVFM